MSGQRGAAAAPPSAPDDPPTPVATTPTAGSRGVRASIRTLRRNTDFRRMWIGQAISEAGSSVSSLSFPLLALALTGSAVNAGLIASVGFVAILLGQLPAGYLADTVDKRVLLIVTDLVRAACLATVAGMAIAGWYRTDAMIALTALNMAAFAVTGPSQYSALRTVVTDAELAEATALMQGRSYAVDLFAPTVGGFLFAVSRALPFAADAASFIFSAGCTARIRASLAPPPDVERVRFRVSFARGWQILWQHRMLRYSTLFSTTTNLVVSVLIYAVLFGSGGSGGAASGLGLTVTLAGVAGMLGAAAGPYVQRRLLLSQVLTASCLVRTIAVLPAVLLDDPVARSLAMVVVVFTSPIAGAAMSTARMLAIPREVLGTVSGASGLLATCAQPLAPLAAGLLIETVGNQVQFGMLGACFLAMAIGVAVPASLRVSAAR